MQVKKQQLEPDMEQRTSLKLRKEYVKAVYCHPAYLTYMQNISCECWTGWNTTGIKIAGRNINNLRYAVDTTLIAESKEELKNLLIKVKEESEKAGLKLSIQKTKITASSPIISWQIDGETMGTVTDFISLVSKITADGDYRHELSLLLFGRKVTTNLDSILKSRHYFANKGLFSQNFGFSCGHVWMWELDYKESWELNNWCFWTVV